MIVGVSFARWVALLCAVLVLASTVRAGNAIAETYLHENALPHALAAVTGWAHDFADADRGSDHRGHLSHDYSDETPADGHHDGNRAGQAGSANHHHHADHNVDLADIVGKGANIGPRPFAQLGVEGAQIAVTDPLWGIERPPRG